MTAKEYLQQYQNANDVINAKLDEIYRLRALATKITQSITPDRVQSSGSQDKVGTIVDKIVDMEHEVDADVDRLQEIKCKVRGTIAVVPDFSQRKVLTLRYINGLRWEQIAVNLNYHYRWVLELHGRGLQAVEASQHCNAHKSSDIV